MEVKILNTNQGPVEYRTVGTGRPVLVLHGGHSNCREEMAIAGLDTTRFQFIIPSRPGYGKTPLREHDSPAAAASLMAALVEALGLPRIIIYGISAGGPTALQLAANFPEMAEKLVLASAVTTRWLQPGDSKYKAAQKLFHPRIQGFTWAMVRLFSRLMPGKMARNFFKEFSTWPEPELSPESVKGLNKALQDYGSGTGFLNDLDQLREDQTFTPISCPVLIIHSRYDASVPEDHPEHARKEISQAKVVYLENKWGHLIWLGPERKKTFWELEEFMSQ